ncbi:hypothetical protein PM082_002250 [Marasmius tenuissimus]|nr:hypothetical protein PM082_002250 [Marasmius tenuissimus]
MPPSSATPLIKGAGSRCRLVSILRPRIDPRSPFPNPLYPSSQAAIIPYETTDQALTMIGASQLSFNIRVCLYAKRVSRQRSPSFSGPSRRLCPRNRMEGLSSWKG